MQVAFWSSVAGQGVEKRLQAEVLNCLSDKHNHLTVHQAIENMDALGRSKLVAFCGLGLQSLFNSVKTFLSDIKCNRPPKYDGQNDSTLFAADHARRRRLVGLHPSRLVC